MNFGGGSSTIIAIVIGAILVIVGFSLWPVLNGANNSLYSYFQDSCNDGSGGRFTKVYLGVTGESTDPGSAQYNLTTNRHGGGGIDLVAPTTGALCTIPASSFTTTNNPGTATAALTDPTLYNEQGESFPSTLTIASSANAAAGTVGGNTSWVRVASVLTRFRTINNLLLTILPVISIAGFLGISGARLVEYGRNQANIGQVIGTSIFTLIGVVVAMVIAGPVMGALVDSNQVVSSGQYEVNGTFGNIIALLFSMIPIVYVAGLVTLVGIHARGALMGLRR